jgi:hypothetical protein
VAWEHPRTLLDECINKGTCLYGRHAHLSFRILASRSTMTACWCRARPAGPGESAGYLIEAVEKTGHRSAAAEANALLGV